MDYGYVTRVARVNAAALASLASAPAPPRNVIIANRLSPDTRLRWTPGGEANLAGYEVVWRETTSPVWTHARSVGNVSTYTVIGRSMDNYIFGVRSVGRNGIKSVAAVPGSARTR